MHKLRSLLTLATLSSIGACSTEETSKDRSSVDSPQNVSNLELSLAYASDSMSTTTMPEYTQTSMPDLPTTTMPEYTQTSMPEVPTTTMPEYTQTSMPDLPTTTMPEYTQTSMPDVPTTTMPTYEQSSMPEVPTTTMPAQTWEYHRSSSECVPDIPSGCSLQSELCVYEPILFEVEKALPGYCNLHDVDILPWYQPRATIDGFSCTVIWSQSVYDIHRENYVPTSEQTTCWVKYQCQGVSIQNYQYSLMCNAPLPQAQNTTVAGRATFAPNMIGD
jgi:hypothetical protein